jgi:hypothetical protein
MSAPAENANARRQPGERVNRLVSDAKLRADVRHVNMPDGFRAEKAKYNPITIGGTARQ